MLYYSYNRMNKSNNMLAKSFGEFFRLKRIKLGYTLRSFCTQFGYDPGNISRLERSVAIPSLDNEILSGYSRALQIKQDSEEQVLFYDLAHSAKGQIPNDIRNNKQVSTMLPAFFRTVRNKQLNEEKLKKLMELLENA